MTEAHSPHGYPSRVFQACERRVGADAPGDLYQEGSRSESPPRARGRGGRRSAGRPDRMGGSPAADVRQLLASYAEDSLAAEGPGVARSANPRSGLGAPLSSSTGSLSGLWASPGARSVGRQVAARDAGPLAGFGRVVSEAHLEGDSG